MEPSGTVEDTESPKSPKVSQNKSSQSEQNLEIDAFMRLSNTAPGSSPGRIVFTYYETALGYDKSSYDPEKTNHSISTDDIEEVFCALEKVKYYNYMEMYYEKVWFNWTMLAICILIPIISLPIVCCLVHKMRAGFAKKSEARCEEIKEILTKFNSDKFHQKNWRWSVGAFGSWLELHGPRTIGLIPEESFEHQGSENGRDVSVSVQERGTPVKNEKKVSKILFENNSSSTPGDKGSSDEMPMKNLVTLEERLL